MTNLSYVHAVILGAVQGLTEFLPISSSGHLAVVQRWLELDAASSGLLLYDVLAHMGTLMAVLVIFAGDVRRFIARLATEGRTRPAGRRPFRRIVMLAVTASVLTGVVGLAWKNLFETAFERPRWIGSCMVMTGVLLAAMAAVPRGRLGWKRFRLWHAALVGLAQAGAILPGISRSGATICVASYLGLRRQWAAQFSFLIATPAIAGGVLLKIWDTVHLPADQWNVVPVGPVLVGSAVAFVVGLAALTMLLGLVRRARLHYFAPYCWCVGFALWAGWI